MFVVGYAYDLRPRQQPQVGVRILFQRIPRNPSQAGDVVLHEGQWTKFETLRYPVKLAIRMGMNPGFTATSQPCQTTDPATGRIRSEPGQSMYWFIQSGFPGDNTRQHQIAWVRLSPWWELMRKEAMTYLNKTCKNTITEDDVFIRYSDRYELERAKY